MVIDLDRFLTTTPPTLSMLMMGHLPPRGDVLLVSDTWPRVILRTPEGVGGSGRVTAATPGAMVWYGSNPQDSQDSNMVLLSTTRFIRTHWDTYHWLLFN